MKKNQQFVSQAAAKYKNARLMILTIFILSAINLFAYILADVYYLFSAYAPLLATSVGYYLYYETGEILFYILSAVIGAIIIVPYILCYIFSRKKVGWMIAALVLFGIDSLIFIPDFLSVMLVDYSMWIDAVVRVIAIVMLALGVKAGLEMEKEPKPVMNETGDAYASVSETSLDAEETETSTGMMRALTITRKKKYTACAVEFVCFENNREICRLKNGKSQTVMVSADAFELGVMFSNGLGSEKVLVPAGLDEISYTVEPKMGFVAAKIEITRV